MQNIAWIGIGAVDMNKISCACGCGNLISPMDKKGRPRKFISGHNSKLVAPRGMLGKIPWNKGKHFKSVGSFKRGHKVSNTGRTWFKKGIKPWNTGLTKETHKGVMKISKSKIGKARSQKTREILSKATIRYLENQKKKDLKIHPVIGALESQILNKLENIWGYKIIRQYKIKRYFIDGYCPEMNLAIEVDEKFHRNKQEQDAIRQQRIEEMIGCKFLRVAI